jgi:hypothetical protein
MRKTVLILWGVGALFLISSIPLFVEGDIGAGVCGIVIAAALFFIGLRKKAAAPAPKADTTAHVTPAADPRPIKAEAAAHVPKADATAHVAPADPRPAKAEAAAPAPASEAKPAFEFLSVKVAGVTFKNGRKSRQTILRKIHFKDEPFNKGTMELTLQREEWEGKPAFGVYVNGDQIGNIPAEYVSYVNDNFSRLDGIVNMEVYGGGEGRNYGAEITLRFRNE